MYGRFIEYKWELAKSQRFAERVKSGFSMSDPYGELDQDIGQFDAQDIFKSRVDSITDAIYELEVPTEFSGK
jgi:hypothetical protein